MSLPSCFRNSQQCFDNTIIEGILVDLEDEESKEELNMVKRIANHLYQKYNLWQMNEMITREDIYHYGVIGLLNAKKKYDPERGASFRAYAPVRISGEIISALRKYPLVRLPQEKQKQVRLLKNTRNELACENLDPSLENIQAKLGWSYAQILAAENLMMTFSSTDDDETRLEIKSERNISNPETIEEVIQWCMEALKNNDDKGLMGIFEARALGNVKLKQLAQQNGCSIQTICNRYDQAKKQMGSCLEEHGFDPEEK